MNSNILQTLADRNSFRFSDFTEACHHYGCTLGDSAIRKRLQDLLKAGEIVRVGHGSYAVIRNEHAHYSYIYSEFSEKIVDQIQGRTSIPKLHRI